MEFYEDNPNFEINLKSNEENGKTSKKSINSLRTSGLKSNKVSPKKEQNQDILMYNINMEKQDIDRFLERVENGNIRCPDCGGCLELTGFFNWD